MTPKDMEPEKDKDSNSPHANIDAGGLPLAQAPAGDASNVVNPTASVSCLSSTDSAENASVLYDSDGSASGEESAEGHTDVNASTTDKVGDGEFSSSAELVCTHEAIRKRLQKLRSIDEGLEQSDLQPRGGSALDMIPLALGEMEPRSLSEQGVVTRSRLDELRKRIDRIKAWSKMQGEPD